MKKQVLIFCLVLLGSIGITKAQQGGGGAKREKIEAMKIGFITQKLNLTPEEAQKFWPVYNKFSDEMEKSRKGYRGKVMEETSDVDNMSNADAEKALNDMIAYRAAEVELLKKYTTEFKKVIPSQKVVKLFLAEQEFKKELLKQLKEQRGGKQN